MLTEKLANAIALAAQQKLQVKTAGINPATRALLLAGIGGVGTLAAIPEVARIAADAGTLHGYLARKGDTVNTNANRLYDKFMDREDDGSFNEASDDRLKALKSDVIGAHNAVADIRREMHQIISRSPLAADFIKRDIEAGDPLDLPYRISNALRNTFE